MTAFTADPYVVSLPERITQPDGRPTQEFQNWLNYDNRWKHDIWRYTGAAENIIGEDTGAIAANTAAIDVNATNISNLNADLTALTGRVTTAEADIVGLQDSQFPTYTLRVSSVTVGVNTWNRVTVSGITLTLPASPGNNDRVVVYKDTGDTASVDVTDGSGTDRIFQDGTLISYRYSSDIGDWVRGA